MVMEENSLLSNVCVSVKVGIPSGMPAKLLLQYPEIQCALDDVLGPGSSNRRKSNYRDTTNRTKTEEAFHIFTE
jgi:hypothetical protein